MGQLLQVNFTGSFITLWLDSLYTLMCLDITWGKYFLFLYRKTDIYLQNDPALAQAILGDDINELQNTLRSRHQQRLELKRKQEEELVSIYHEIALLLKEEY